MLKLTPNPTFKADVRLTVPGEEAPASVRLEFRHKTLAAVQDWLKSNESKQSAAALTEIIVGWEGVEDESGPAPFSQESLAAVLANYPAATSEIVGAYLRELTASRLKN